MGKWSNYNKIGFGDVDLGMRNTLKEDNNMIKVVL